MDGRAVRKGRAGVLRGRVLGEGGGAVWYGIAVCKVVRIYAPLALIHPELRERAHLLRAQRKTKPA